MLLTRAFSLYLCCLLAGPRPVRKSVTLLFARAVLAHRDVWNRWFSFLQHQIRRSFFWHRAQFISWLQYRLLEPQRMLYFEGDAAGEKLLLFVLDCKSPSSTQKKGWFNDQRNAFKKHENKAKAFLCCRSAYSRANTVHFTMTINGLIIKHFYWAVHAPISDISFQLLPLIPLHWEDREDPFPSCKHLFSQNTFWEKIW